MEDLKVISMRGSVVLIILNALVTFPVLAHEIPVESIIKSAVVYNDRATLTRTAQVKIPAGAHVLNFIGLPVILFPDSLRTEGKAASQVTLGAIAYKMESHEDFVVPKEQELHGLLEKLEDQKIQYDAEKQAVAIAQKFLDKLGEQAAQRSNEDIARINLKPEEWKGAADSLHAKTLENLKSINAIDIAIRHTDEQIAKINQELAQLRTDQKQTYRVQIPYESQVETTLTIDLSYQLPKVSWQPVYDARLDVASGKMSLVQYGAVWQQTGEDWNGIDLTLSTAQPSRGAGLPDLYTQWVSIVEPIAKTALQESKMRRNEAAAPASMMAKEKSLADEGMTMYEADNKVVEQEAVFAAAQINTQGFVGEYQIPGPSTVKADGTQSKLLIGAFETQSTMQIQIKPQLSTSAYLVLKATLKGDAPVLPGQVHLFRDGAYIGQSTLPMLRPGDESQLAFGIDDNVSVKRNVLKDERAESGLISKEASLERHAVTEIKNLHKTPFQISVLETIPASQDARVRVEVLNDNTTQGYKTDINDQKGMLEWSMTLQSGAMQKINLGWRVYWPKGSEITGL